MSVRARVDDGLFLWEHKRLEGAFMSVLAAVAASARLRYPNRKAIGDRVAFERFLKNAMLVTIGVEFRGEAHPVEHIFYKWLRCELVHEGGIPVDIEFVQTEDPTQLSIRAGGQPEYVLKLSQGWFYHLVNVVATAPENAVEFVNFAPQLAKSISSKRRRKPRHSKKK
jgi:hypothetical protein